MNGTSIGEARRSLAQTFRRARLDSPDLDARLLVAHALGLDHATLASQAERGLTSEEARRIACLAARRLGREPVARILGVKEFWGLSLALNADTLVPRPDSEIIVEAALAALPPLQTDERRARPWRIADLGTGSGALLLALLSELPTARGIGTDISLPALACARANAQALGCADRVAFVACDYAAALAGPFDLIVCNPPYVLRDDMESLPAEVRLFDPPRALDGGPDGLDAYRALAAQAQRLLTPDGRLVVELGSGQHADVSRLFTMAGLAVGPVRHDLSGIARALVISRVPGILHNP